MSEKTPFIVLTVVFVVGIVGFVLMMTEANTGAATYGRSIYEVTRTAAETPGGDPSQTARQALNRRALYGSMVQQGENLARIEQKTGISTGQAYAKSGEALGTLGIAGTVKKEDSSSIPYRRVIDNARGCTTNVPWRTGQIGWQYAVGTDALEDSIRSLEWYKNGDTVALEDGRELTVMVRPCIANKPLIWGAEDTACAYQTGITSTY
jgi:hypothetical protein